MFVFSCAKEGEAFVHILYIFHIHGKVLYNIFKRAFLFSVFPTLSMIFTLQVNDIDKKVHNFVYRSALGPVLYWSVPVFRVLVWYYILSFEKASEKLKNKTQYRACTALCWTIPALYCTYQVVQVLTAWFTWSIYQ